LRHIQATESPRRGPRGARSSRAGAARQNVVDNAVRFFTADVERSGTGLGLAIAKSAMETHGGTIEARSRPGEGTTTRLRFPRRGA
jgi:signal transduction histidine kinase